MNGTWSPTSQSQDNDGKSWSAWGCSSGSAPTSHGTWSKLLKLLEAQLFLYLNRKTRLIISPWCGCFKKIHNVKCKEHNRDSLKGR